MTVDPEIPVPPTLYGGIERIAAGLLAELRRRGHAVGLVARPGSTAPADATFGWPGLRSQHRGDTVRNLLALHRAVQAFRPDVIHSFSRLAYLLPVLGRVPVVMSYQREPSRRTVGLAARLGGRRLRFTGCSEYICQRGRPAGGTWDAVHNFADTAAVRFAPAVPADAPLVFLSRVESIKGPDTAIRVAQAAGRRLVIAGNHGGTPAEAEFWRAAVEPEVGRGGVEYVGPVDDDGKSELLGRATALLVPIRWDEPFGIVFAEALAAGTPVLSCPRGAVPEIVEPGVTGFLSDDPAELTAAVARVGGLDRAACRRAAEGRFSAAAVAGQYERVYQSVRGAT